MLDVHPPFEATHTWKDFFIHVATICVGLLIAVGLEQTVVLIHRHHQARVAREAIDAELHINIRYNDRNVKTMTDQQDQLQLNLNALDSATPVTRAIPSLKYRWDMSKGQNSAWASAKINGSLALIPPSDIERASYFYESEDALDSMAYNYFSDMDAAAALVEHASSTGKLTPAVRQQLLTLTISALGRCRTLLQLMRYEQQALRDTHLGTK